ncbi:MAG: carboxypeptidase regulatory-like domain-containing protein, partial [Propionibacteriaceae bacterium]|nr:carboxypeptidase regulatory-like domain-containing protein [Propionibacteriaceae bacterium]
MSSAVQNAARYDKLRKRLWKPFAAAATFAMVASTFAGLSTQMASAITPTNQAGTYGIWAPYYASSYSDKGTNYRATGIDFGGYEHSRLWVAGFGSDNTGNGATNTEDITLDDDANSLVVGVWGGYFETSDTSDNYADITSARPIAAWGWWNTRDTADGYASGTTTIPLFGNNLNRTDSPNGHADARKQGGTLAVDGGLYSGQAGYVGNGPAAYFTSVDDGGGSDKNPYDRDGNHAPSASVITASGLASSKTGGSNDCVEDTNGRTDKSGAWWFLVTEVRGSVGETGSYTYSSASDRANAFWIPSSNMAAMKGAAPAVGYRCIGTHDLAEQQGWSGAEVYQRTGEIFFINDRGVNLVSYGRGYFGLNTCDDGSNSKNAAGISCDKNKLRIMAYNPSNGDWRLSGPMLPEEAADSIFHQGEDPENAGDLAFDSRGNIYTLMEGKAPAPGYGMTNGESEWWRAGDVPDGSLHIYLVRFKQGAHNGNWTYHIIQRFEASPSADADTKEAWGTGSTPVSTSGRKNLKNWEAFAFFNGSIYGATVTKPNGDNDVLTRASLGNGFAYPVENPERPGTDTYGRDPSRRGGITNNLNNIRDIASTQVAHVVEGYVWDDVNADGNITADEKALPQRSIDVALYRELGDGTWELQGTRQTDHNGYYEFLTAGNGKYHVRVDHPVINGVNAVQTWASAGDQGPDPLNPGSMITVDNVVTAHCYDSATDTSVEITSSGACEGNIKMPYKEPDSPVNQMADPDPLAIVSGMPDKTPIYSTINIISNDTEPEVDFGITASTTWGDAKNPPFNTTIAQNGARTVQGIAEALYLGDSYGKYTDGVNDTNAAAHTTDDGITWLPALQNGQALQNATLVAGKMYNVSAKVQGYITDATVKGWLSGPGATSMADATADFSATRSGTSATGTLTMPSYSGSGTVPVQARFVAYPTVENISQPDNTGNQYQSTARTYVSANDSAQPDTNYFTTPGEVEDYQVQMAAAILRLGAQADDTSLVTEDYTYALTNVTPNSDSLRPTTDDTPVWSSSIHTPTGAASPRAVVITSSGNDDTVIDEDNTSCFDTVSGSAVSFTADKDAGTVTVADLADGNDVTCLIAYTAAAEPPTVELDDPTVEGPVTGTVTDENGDPISGAPVTVTDEDDNVLCTATTNASGEFSCQPNRDLEPGEDITATATDPDTGLEGSDTKPVIDQLEVEVDEPLQEGTTGPITGTVTDPDGDPVSGADVTVTDADDNVLCTTTTAADGTFSCNSNRPLEDGETITAKAEDPATGNTGEDDATVGPGLGVEIDEPQYKDAPVSGTVTDPSGDPVEGADVTVKDADDNVLCTATTAADGTWSCQPSRELEPGEEITAEAEDPDTGLTGEDDATVEDPLGVTIDDPKAGDEVITGTVTDENGDPVSGAEVTITDEDDNVLCTATTAADGSYECNSSRPLEEDETITAKAEDPVTGNTGEDDATVGPPADLTVEIDEPQYKDAPVTGTVTDENGDPVDGADVEVKDADDNVLCTTTTASDGTFSCQPSRPLEPGETITAEATDPDTGATGEDDATVADPLEVTVDEPLAAGDTEVSGTVTDPDGNPVANADVTVTDEDDNVLCTTTTDATGAFTCTTSRPLEEGETVTASAEDPATGNTGEDDATVGEDPCVAAGNCVNVEVDEPLTKDGPVTGTVTDENGDPLADAPVTVTDSDGNELCSTTTASDGTFSCQPSRDLEPGETITAEATDPDTGQTGSDDATAPSGPDVALDSPAAGSDPITGTVTDPETGDPISGAPVVVTDDEGNELCSTTTAADGTFSCTPNRPLEDGETITATATDPDTGFEGTDEAEVGEPACAATNTCVNVEVDEPLTKDGPVTGTVTDENGDPIADAPVVVTDSEGNELCSTTTAADGTFSCQPNRPLEPGETITATATDPDNGQTGSDDATAPSG